MSDVQSLCQLDSGWTAAVEALRGGHGFRSRLAALGFTPGARITMLQNVGHGPIIVTLRDTRIALGRAEANRILVVSDRDAANGRA